MATTVCSILYQLPAILLYKRLGSEALFGSQAFHRYFLNIDGEEQLTIQPRFFDPITKQVLGSVLYPVKYPDSNENSNRLVTVEVSDGNFQCFIESSFITVDEDKWLIVHLTPTDTNLVATNQNSVLAAKHVQFNQLMSTLSSELINANDDEVDSIINQCLSAFGEFSGVDRCYLFEFLNDLTAMNNTHEWVGEGVKLFIEDLQGLPTDSLPYFIKHIQQGVFKLDDVNNLPEAGDLEKAEFKRESSASVLCSPIYCNNELYGFIGCDIIGTPYDWKQHDVEYLSRIAEMLGNTIENLRNPTALHSMQVALLEANSFLYQRPVYA